MNRRSLIVAVIAVIPFAGCTETEEQPVQAATAHLTPVVVDNCYSGNESLEVFVDEAQLELTPPRERDDSLGLCFGEEIELDLAVQVRVASEDFEYSVELEWEEEKTLVIGGIDPESVYGYAPGFQDPSTLLYD